MKLLVEEKTKTEAEDNARQKWSHSLRSAWNVWAHKKCAELDGHDGNHACDFCKCNVCVRILNDEEYLICSVLGCRPRLKRRNN
jgi:hypothetical protein